MKRFVELRMKNTVLIRAATKDKLRQRVQQLHLQSLFNSPGVSIDDIISTRPKPLGDIFSATL